MRKFTAFCFALALVLTSSSNAFAIKSYCEPGLAVYNPWGEFADCLEGGGEDCYACVVYPP